MASRILAANLDIGFGIRPALWVTMAGLMLVAVNAVSVRKGAASRGRRAAVAAE